MSAALTAQKLTAQRNDAMLAVLTGLTANPELVDLTVNELLDRAERLVDELANRRTRRHEAFVRALQTPLANHTHPTCSRCGGTGEILASSTSVGGGAVNDHWDVCPRCNGTGKSPVWSTDPHAITDAEIEALR